MLHRIRECIIDAMSMCKKINIANTIKVIKFVFMVDGIYPTVEFNEDQLFSIKIFDIVKIMVLYS